MSKLELAAGKYSESIFTANEEEMIISRMSFRAGYLLKACEAEVGRKELLRLLSDCVNSWGDYSPSPQSNAAKALAKAKEAIANYSIVEGKVLANPAPKKRGKNNEKG